MSYFPRGTPVEGRAEDSTTKRIDGLAAAKGIALAIALSAPLWLLLVLFL
ncbi:MAG: hypothetical protein JOY71_27140 [Acetobacteraceae bacterium]|nr:hypothetical protein [Acetobacteraceae bacterium]MBV8525744.1 hypothetical protein [Acetobacteraceae bacterium]